MENKFCLIKTAIDSEEKAVTLAKMLLNSSLIVSGQIKEMRSLYIWKDESYDEKEFELTCFTESRFYSKIEEFINRHHSYELCQIICIPITNISKGFGNWIFSYVGKEKEDDCKLKDESSL